MTYNTPTREQFEAAAKLVGLEIVDLPRAGKEPIAVVKRKGANHWEEVLSNWRPDINWSRAFELLCKVEEWLWHQYDNGTEKYDDVERVRERYHAAQRTGNPEAIALATFNLAAEIGRTMP